MSARGKHGCVFVRDPAWAIGGKNDWNNAQAPILNPFLLGALENDKKMTKDMNQGKNFLKIRHPFGYCTCHKHCPSHE